MQASYDDAMAQEPRPRTIKLKPLLGQAANFGDLMDWPTVFPIARAVIGSDITLASGGEADCRLPGTGPTTIWHTDLEWLPDLPYPRPVFMIRCTFLLEDLLEDQGPVAVIPKTHVADSPPPPNMNADGRPLLEDDGVSGIVRLIGGAGSCILNNTEIWHTSTPNTSVKPRITLQFLYKHAWMQPWAGPDNEIPAGFSLAQDTPLRQQLCGLGVWHRFNKDWDA
jgi:ectoine hydroxylase-related dioxygenase (phytanoyl-CoA dioxygenase family)